jgi:hypothetical protein
LIVVYEVNAYDSSCPAYDSILVILDFSQILNVHNVSDVRQREVYKAEPLVPGSSRLEVEIAIAKLKRYKSPGSDQIPAELIQAGG